MQDVNRLQKISIQCTRCEISIEDLCKNLNIRLNVKDQIYSQVVQQILNCILHEKAVV